MLIYPQLKSLYAILIHTLKKKKKKLIGNKSGACLLALLNPEMQLYFCKDRHFYAKLCHSPNAFCFVQKNNYQTNLAKIQKVE